jgi:transposase InsO family protein
MDGGGAIEEYDAYRGDKLRVGAYSTLHWFKLPQTLTTDQGASFMSHQFREFTALLKIRLLNSSPYYAQANGQAEASNKALIKLIKKKIDEQSEEMAWGIVGSSLGTPSSKAWGYKSNTVWVGISIWSGAAHRSQFASM